ncbi:MAG: cbb3-type cytochrome c oxidase subunit 3 [Burkholderiales bacterium]|jgi:cytochrome c oxidase cbb3-type subunit 4|nr:cbb3-type cytochrome c oxidase subunit 3 [Burkholderiales bacterium]MBP7519061.1 cbb3-type cytochrome c oxidase subunit 3 [Leptothrix sp. (in: b-proteobacteria)]HQY08606.1 cbb3-type cytochrome c oxidase subunit 3 [Burkholderiaceae bacterium]
MDLNDLRVTFTLVSFAVFLGIAAWAYARKNSSQFDEAARLPLHDEGEGGSQTPSGGTHE